MEKAFLCLSKCSKDFLKFITILIFILPSFTNLFSEESKEKKIAVLNITSRSELKEIDISFLTERLQVELSKFKGLKIVERLELKKLLEEQKLQLSGIAEKDAVKVGGLLGAQKIVTGSITEVDGKYFLVVKVIDVETSEINFIDQITGTTQIALSEKIKGLARRIAFSLLGETLEIKKVEIETPIEEKKEKEIPEKTTEPPLIIIDKKWFPFGIVLISPIQIPSRDFRIMGITVGFIGGYSELYGFQNGFMNINDRTYGVQNGYFNISKGEMHGLQTGFINIARDVIGAQIGFLNFAYKMVGVQIGFLNFITTGFLPVMVGINISF